MLCLCEPNMKLDSYSVVPGKHSQSSGHGSVAMDSRIKPVMTAITLWQACTSRILNTKGNCQLRLSRNHLVILKLKKIKKILKSQMGAVKCSP